MTATTAAAALADLIALAGSVDGLTATDGARASQVSLPAVVVGAPTPTWDTYCSTTTMSELRFPVTLLVRLDDLAVEACVGFLDALAGALESSAATVESAVPVSYDLGNGVTAAGYELTVNYSLGG